ncbi:hypothetical protein BJ138DRAFT_1106387 [Hygrophoropsis aurantiaca]|uniref:Uncharacterized protein n=1 Tax=Hygrophoropsis aurantiaca TaxID=72124 RepID=A0ACB7ZW86_9AGAM|nr:hypothetical protein BJ138DRAFT_1106387 [Hygrophoropsis aurantiaca]
MAEDRADYVDYAVPILDDNDSTSAIPFMWKVADYDETTETWTLSGAFLSEYILDTFAHHLEILDAVESNEWKQRLARPRGALALSTVTVERAFRYYETGDLVFPPIAALKAFSSGNWSRKTEQVMGSLDHTTNKAWKKIIAAATPYIGAHKARLLGQTKQASTSKQVSSRSLCFEPDSDGSEGE